VIMLHFAEQDATMDQQQLTEALHLLQRTPQ
jgi:hypothetical protein